MCDIGADGRKDGEGGVGRVGLLNTRCRHGVGGRVSELMWAAIRNTWPINRCDRGKR